jgi:hypothetical protein
MRECDRCSTSSDGRNLFCGNCGKAYSRAELQTLRLMGPIGVGNSNNPKIEQFWRTGDPTVFD